MDQKGPPVYENSGQEKVLERKQHEQNPESPAVDTKVQPKKDVVETPIDILNNNDNSDNKGTKELIIRPKVIQMQLSYCLILWMTALSPRALSL